MLITINESVYIARIYHAIPNKLSCLHYQNIHVKSNQGLCWRCQTIYVKPNRRLCLRCQTINVTPNQGLCWRCQTINVKPNQGLCLRCQTIYVKPNQGSQIDDPIWPYGIVCLSSSFTSCNWVSFINKALVQYAFVFVELKVCT